MKENILKKIKEMRIGGFDNFKLQCSKYIIEFRLFQISNVVFLAVSGGGVTLNTYFINELTRYEDIIKDIEYSVFKGIDLNIKDSKFIS